ncbi:MAG: fumarylacetoacetate hydrolase family protein [Chloroflexi bacterium]|nr:fumarylacetoacetate hydrolase family protein [Chloroflexota bacterium]
MRWVRYEADGKTSYGILNGEEISEVSGNPFESYSETGTTRTLGSVKLLIPFEPKTFYAAGINYEEHVREAAKLLNREPDLPDKADIGYRANNALIAHNEPIVKPRDSGERFQYEGELVVVIGKQAKHLSEAEALSCVLGYTIGNDVSERDWQAADRTMWRAKNSDTFKPMGPWIETDVELDKLRTQVRVNGQVVSDFATNNMIFGVQHYISVMTRNITLFPGDMIWMGTDGATQNMKPGDICEVDIDGIGVLSNPIIAEA